MLVYARIVGGVVAEMIEIASGGPPINERFHPDVVATMVAVPDDEPVAVGWQWDGEAFAPPLPIEAPDPPMPRITARQLRLWLLSQGRPLSAVDTAIATLPVPQREAARVEWEYSTEYDRGHPLIASIGDALEFTAEEIDAGFLQAAAL